MFSTTIISQVMMSVIIMAMTFVGRWFAFPRTIILINLIASIILLFSWRVLILEVYIRISGVSKVMIIGTEEQCKEAVLNFKTSETRQYKVEAVAFDKYYENIKKNLDKIDVFYLLDTDSAEEEQTILKELTLQSKRIFFRDKFWQYCTN